MRAREPSSTAQMVAQHRAAHQLLDQPCVFTDPLAVAILGPAGAAALRADPRHTETSPVAPMLRTFLALRNRVAEDTLASLVAQGLRQYVVLGAGLDTFAYRNPHPGLRVWEVDHPATQAWKRERLAEAGIPVPAPAPFVAVDFETQELGEMLARAGLDPAAPAFFSWLGVTLYLPEAAVDATLACVARAARTGGGIVFDYCAPPSSLEPRQRAVFDAMAERVQASGEPWRTFFDPPLLVQRLHALGFAEVEDLSGEALNRLLFAVRGDGLRVGSLGRLIRARNPLAHH